MEVRYIVDSTGKPRQVVLEIDEYEELLEKLEDAEALAFLKELKGKPMRFVSLDEALTGMQSDV